jgi:hypothetical protein
MRLGALVLAGMLSAAPLAAQTGQPAQASSSPQPDDQAPPSYDLPVSLDRIRSALERPASLALVRRLDDAPTFRLQIFERQKIDELLATLDFKSGPVPLGGTYGYEQQRVVFPPVDYPTSQPLGAFSQGQLFTILLENVVGKYVAGRATAALSRAVHTRAEAATRREIDEAISDYCAEQTNGGAGIQLCNRTTP